MIAWNSKNWQYAKRHQLDDKTSCHQGPKIQNTSVELICQSFYHSSVLPSSFSSNRDQMALRHVTSWEYMSQTNLLEHCLLFQIWKEIISDYYFICNMMRKSVWWDCARNELTKMITVESVWPHTPFCHSTYSKLFIPKCNDPPANTQVLMLWNMVLRGLRDGTASLHDIYEEQKWLPFSTVAWTGISYYLCLCLKYKHWREKYTQVCTIDMIFFKDISDRYHLYDLI